MTLGGEQYYGKTACRVNTDPLRLPAKSLFPRTHSDNNCPTAVLLTCSSVRAAFPSCADSGAECPADCFGTHSYGYSSGFPPDSLFIWAMSQTPLDIAKIQPFFQSSMAFFFFVNHLINTVCLPFFVSKSYCVDNIIAVGISSLKCHGKPSYSTDTPATPRFPQIRAAKKSRKRLI